MTLTVVKLDGDLDFSRKAHTTQLLQRADNVDIAIVDLSGVSYMDSSCLSCLAAQRKRMQEHGRAGILRIAGASSALQRVFAICGLDRTFEMYASVEAARNGEARLSTPQIR